MHGWPGGRRTEWVKFIGEGCIGSGFDLFHSPYSLWAPERDIRGELGSAACDGHGKCDGQGEELFSRSLVGRWAEGHLEALGILG